MAGSWQHSKKLARLAMAEARLCGIHPGWFKVFDSLFIAGSAQERYDRLTSWVRLAIDEVEAYRADGKRHHYENEPPRG